MTFFGIVITLKEALLAGSLVLVAIYFLNKTAFKQLRWSLSGLIGRLAKKLWAANAVDVYKAQVRDVGEKLKVQSRIVLQQQGELEVIKQKLKAKAVQCQKLESAIAFLLEKGDEAEATNQAQLLAQAEQDKASLEEQVKNVQNIYDSLVKEHNVMLKKVGDLKNKAQVLEAEYNSSKAQRQMAELKDSIQENVIDSSDLSAAENEIHIQVAMNQGQAAASKQMQGRDISAELAEDERNRNAAAIISRLKAKKS